MQRVGRAAKLNWMPEKLRQSFPEVKPLVDVAKATEQIASAITPGKIVAKIAERRK